VQTRLRKTHESDWQGAIYAAAGLKRLQLEHEITLTLDWMLPAPAQGAVAVVCRTEDAWLRQTLLALHHTETGLATQIERQFLNRVEGGCSAPLGALAVLQADNTFSFKGLVLTPDGKQAVQVTGTCPADKAVDFGYRMGDQALQQGADEILRAIQQQ
jgi:hydroxymethylbilane synthase